MTSATTDCGALEVACLDKKPNKLRQGFISLAESLLESVADVFPECDNTTAVLEIFRRVVKGSEKNEDKFIRRCQELFKDQAEQIKEKDEEALFIIVESLEYLKEIQLREKWEDPDFTTESREHLWQYVCSLKTYSDLYASVPANVMGKIEKVAGEIGDQFANGNLDLQKMNLGAIGQSLLSDMSPEEIANFEGNLPDIYSSLSEVATSMGGGSAGINIDGLMEQLAKQCGESGDPLAAGDMNSVDMTRVLQQLSAGMQPGQAPNIDMSQILSAMAPLMQNAAPALNHSVNGAANQRVVPRRRRGSRLAG